MTKKDPKPTFVVQLPLDRVQTVHKTSEDYPPTDIGQYGLYSADNQSQDELLLLGELENRAVEDGAMRG